MKKVSLILAMVFSTLLLTNCSDSSKELEQLTLEQLKIKGSESSKIDPIKDCPQNDRNCNGIPDNQE